MALNLSTLTNASTSGDVLAEALTTADFLEGVPVLRNLARGSQKGGDAKQGTALNQPRALPYDGKGYLYLSGVSGNYASVPDPLGALGDFTMQVDGLNAGAVRPDGLSTLISQYSNSGGFFASFILRIYPDGRILLVLYSNSGSETLTSSAIPTNTIGIQVKRVGSNILYLVDTGLGYNSHDTDTSNGNALSNPSRDLQIGTFNNTGARLKGKIGRAVIWNNGTASGTPVLDVDFTATNVRHGDTKFACATGQVVTINQSGNDPATVIKKSVLRFANTPDGSSTINLKGLFGQTISEGYLFAGFSVLGDGGAGSSRIVSFNSTGATDVSNVSYIAAYGDSTQLSSFTGGVGNITQHVGIYDKANGDFIFENKFKASSQISRINNADFKTNTANLSNVSTEEFNIAANATGGDNAAIDLEFLALFPASITDDQADSVRNYINNRNNVFSLIDGFGYYFYDAQKAPVGNITQFAVWSGRIVGSDNGDNTSIFGSQATANDQPVSDGYVVTFADNSDHLDIPSTTQAGWQVVGTSIGTFLYKVRNEAQTEFSLLGYIGNASYRQAGDLYGAMLLPESATTADLNAARKLLTDRGASDGATSRSYYAAWFQRDDIVEFGGIDLSAVTSLDSSWGGATKLVKFHPTAISNCTNFSSSWSSCIELNDFAAIQAPLGSNFSSAWKDCSALTSFPAGAKLGTAVNNVNFSSAWQSSGLTSFELDLSTGNIFTNTFRSSALTSFGGCDLSKGVSFKNCFYLCSNLTEISAFAKFGTNAVNVDFDSAFNATGLTAFPALDLSNGRYFAFTFQSCTSLIDFSPGVFNNWNPSSITTGVFNKTWDGCSALSALSVENILTSIDASGKYATTNGASGGTALGDAAIDIDYNTATGSLSAATNTAVTSLKAKGWSIIVNNVTL